MVLQSHNDGFTGRTIMNSLTTPAPLVREAADADRRWFFGGGVHTWLATEDETGGTFMIFEDQMEGGKVTPLHTHPSDETLYLLEGEILVHMDGQESTVTAGGLVIAPRGVPHAFKVVSGVARLLTLHTPGSCQSFYLGASEPITGDQPASGVVDFDKVMESGQSNGGITILGPPPFAQP